MVDRKTVGAERASAEAVIARLEALHDSTRPAAIAFDGDGTLWSGDVSEDVFLHTVERGGLRSEATDDLRATAAKFGISGDGTPSAIAERIFRAYRDGRFPEREVCEMMTWCYAGFTRAELGAHAATVLRSLDLDGRLKRHLAPILSWARGRGIRTVVVSASPRIIVEFAASLWDFTSEDIAASDSAFEGDRIAPRMAGEVPYEVAKCRAGSRLLEGSDWLASFGDNIYDVDMMRVAKLGVVVDAKPALEQLLPSLPVLVLEH